MSHIWSTYHRTEDETADRMENLLTRAKTELINPIFYVAHSTVLMYFGTFPHCGEREKSMIIKRWVSRNGQTSSWKASEPLRGNNRTKCWNDYCWFVRWEQYSRDTVLGTDTSNPPKESVTIWRPGGGRGSVQILKFCLQTKQIEGTHSMQLQGPDEWSLSIFRQNRSS